MQKFILILISFFFLGTVTSQKLSQVNIKGNGTVDVFMISLDENVQLYLTKDGNISKWGYDRFMGIQENFGSQLDPYVGRVEYYTQNDDAALQGKVKYIGRIMLTYYTSFENETLKGKIKTIGSISFDYFLNYEDAAFKGNIKKIGQQNVAWYSSFDNEGYRGKLKTLGSTSFTYYSFFEDKAFRGKIKNIGGNSFVYFSSFENFSGSLKSGSMVSTINNIKYFVLNY
jgi:hypothetical protein